MAFSLIHPVSLDALIVGANLSGSRNIQYPVVEAASQTANWASDTTAGSGGYKPYGADREPADVLSVDATPVSGSAGVYTAAVADGRLTFTGGAGAPDGSTWACTTAGGVINVAINVVADPAYVVIKNSHLDGNLDSWRELESDIPTGVTDVNYKGGTIILRHKCEIIEVSNYYSPFRRKGDLEGITFLGEGPDTAWENSNFHFGNAVNVVRSSSNWVNCKFVNVAFKMFAFTNGPSNGRGGPYWFTKCHFQGTEQDLFGDFTTSPPSGTRAVNFISNGNPDGLSVIDCTFSGCGVEDHQVSGFSNKWLEFVGNRIDQYYNDAVKSSAPLAIFGGNVFTGCLFNGTTDTDYGYHADVIQISAPQDAYILEANMIHAGNTRADGDNQQIFVKDDVYTLSTTGPGTSMAIRGCVGFLDSYFGTTFIRWSEDSIISNCSALPDRNLTTFPISILGSNFCQVALSSMNDGGDGKIYNSVGGSIIEGGTATGTNVNGNAWSEAQWDAAFPNRTYCDDITRPTFAQILTAATPDAAGAAAGKGATAMVGAPTDPDRPSTYTMDDTLVPVPTLSAVSVSSIAATTATGNVTTDVGLNPILWAIVPDAWVSSGDIYEDYREIKEGEYRSTVVINGYEPVGSAGGAIAIAITGLTASTDYRLLIIQENGWTKRSVISNTAFTTTA